jgi:succinate dehydrogenase/fumarate reductase cytochrome b subunit
MMKNKTKKILTAMMFLGLCAFNIGILAHSVSAQSASNSWDEYTPLAPLPGTTNEGGKTDIQTYIPGIFKLAIGIASVLAVLMIIIGGVEYITTDAIQGKSEGKARIQNALWGLVLVLVSWILLYTINQKQLTIFNLNVETTTSEQTRGSSNYGGDGTTDNTADNGTYNNGLYNDGTNYIEGTENPLEKPNLDISGIGEDSSVGSSDTPNDGTNYIEGTENPLYKPNLQY